MKNYFEKNLSLKDILIDIFQNTYNAKTKKILDVIFESFRRFL